MGNYLILAVLALTVAPIVFSILLGLIRGSRRSLLRLILVLVCAVLAFVLCGVVANKVLEADVSMVVQDEEIGSMTLAEYLQNMLGEDMEDMSDFIVPIVKSIVKVVMFLVLFEVLKLITWIIVYPLCKLFVKPKKVVDGSGHTKKKKRRLIGAVFGLVQGAVVALCICIIVNGFIGIAGDLTAAMDGLSDFSDSSEPSEQVAMLSEDGGAEDDAQSGSKLDSIDLKGMIEEYNGSIFGKMYNAIGSKPFTFVSSVKVSDEKTITLTGQVEALSGLVKIGKEFLNITDLDLDNVYTEANLTKLQSILENVKGIKNSLSDEARTTVNEMVDILGDKMGVKLDFFSKIDTMNVDGEIAALRKLGECAEKDYTGMTQEQIIEEAKDLAKELAKSDLLVEILEEQNINFGDALDDDLRDEIDGTLAELVADGTIDQAKADQLREILCSNGQQNSGDNGDQLAQNTARLAFAR